MSEQPFESPDASAVVIEELRATNRSIADLEVVKLKKVIEWIVVNEVDPATHESGPCCDRALRTAGAGSPYVPEFDLQDFAACLGMSSESGQSYICGVAELRYRLGTLWDQVEAGDLPAWRGLKIAQSTWTLPEAGAAYVDRHLAQAAGSCSWAQIDRLVAEATARFDPAKAEENRKRLADGRRFDIGLGFVGIDGIVQVDASLDLADALDLEAAISSVATQLLGLGCQESLDVRRSIAAGELARAQGALDLGSSTSRSVTLNVHLNDAALRGEDNVGRCQNTRTPITVGQVRDWCGNPHTTVTVQPILDLDQHHFTEAYEIPKRLEQQAEITIGTCVFPYCTRDAVKCDKDHVLEWTREGPTCSCNIAPLCRNHHRAKTHSKWSYVALDPGIYLWTTPTGFDLIRDQRGTRRPPPTPPIDDRFGPSDDRLHPLPDDY